MSLERNPEHVVHFAFEPVGTLPQGTTDAIDRSGSFKKTRTVKRSVVTVEASR